MPVRPTKEELRLLDASNEPIDLRTFAIKYKDKGSSLFELFLQDGPSELANIKSAHQAENQLAFAQAVHGLRGICGAICATKMRNTCAELEHEAKAGNRGALEALIHRLEKELTEALEFVIVQLRA
jgi:HPt (histidine-containing phosphotransfer) domain-containing protein